MGIDGLSIANTGIVKESTSADMAAKTEQSQQADPTNDSKQVQTLVSNRRVREKDEEEGKPKKQKKDNAEEFHDGYSEAEDPDNDDFSEDDNPNDVDIDNLNKEFYVKLNAKSDIIELYDSSTNRLIETISGDELAVLVKKLNMASGIFVNKKV